MREVKNWSDVTTVINGLVNHYMADLVHDGIIFAQNVGKELLWSIGDCGTHLYGLDTIDARLVDHMRQHADKKRSFVVRVVSVGKGPELELTELVSAEDWLALVRRIIARG